ncbi:MAG: transcriptional regulator [Acetobacteraceae bacterium]|nr:transcriptional regulator [Acetobacteraceae bacterium]
MLSDDELRQYLRDFEADHVERTLSPTDTNKFGQAICAFANDMPGRWRTGVLFVGARDNGDCANIDIDERLVQILAGFRSDGTITPFPAMHVRKHVLDGCAMAIVEVEPSDNPPLKYQGRVCVRIGPLRGYATAEEERRLTEKRRWGNLPFDQQPVAGTSLSDLNLPRFQEEYLPAVVPPDVLAENGREITDQLRALRILAPDGRPTAAGLLICGKSPRAWLPGAYIQFVRYPGAEIGDIVQNHKEIDGPLSHLLRRLDEVIAHNIETWADLSGVVQRNQATYPTVALQELARNAVIHRTYEGTAAPVRLTWFSDRVEIMSPGGPYGAVTIDSFGDEGVTDYRNPTLGEAAKALGFIQRFGSGIPRARAALARNGNPPPEFLAAPSYVRVTVRIAPAADLLRSGQTSGTAVA